MTRNIDLIIVIILMLNIINAFPLMILLCQCSLHVKFENLMVFHYAQICQFEIMTSEATTAQ